MVGAGIWACSKSDIARNGMSLFRIITNKVAPALSALWRVYKRSESPQSQAPANSGLGFGGFHSFFSGGDAANASACCYGQGCPCQMLWKKRTTVRKMRKNTSPLTIKYCAPCARPSSNLTCRVLVVSSRPACRSPSRSSGAGVTAP